MRRAFALMFLLSLLQGALAWAALDSAPIDDGGRARAARSLAAAGNDAGPVYSISQSKLDSGTIVREYYDAAGVVFAVSWKGPTMPHLGALLGDKLAPGGHARLPPGQPDVMIVSNGYRNAYAGHAWIPGALPPGFEHDDD